MISSTVCSVPSLWTRISSTMFLIRNNPHPRGDCCPESFASRSGAWQLAQRLARRRCRSRGRAVPISVIARPECERADLPGNDCHVPSRSWSIQRRRSSGVPDGQVAADRRRFPRPVPSPRVLRPARWRSRNASSVCHSVLVRFVAVEDDQCHVVFLFPRRTDESVKLAHDVFDQRVARSNGRSGSSRRRGVPNISRCGSCASIKPSL